MSRGVEGHQARLVHIKEHERTAEGPMCGGRNEDVQRCWWASTNGTYEEVEEPWFNICHNAWAPRRADAEYRFCEEQHAGCRYVG